MAEMPDIGAKCDFVGCNRLDFLPFSCPLCKCFYCSDHRFVHGCDNSKQYDPNTSKPPSSGPLRAFVCSFSNCSLSESIKIVCPHCERNFCLKHRHADEHLCDAVLSKTPKPQDQQRMPVIESSNERPSSKTKSIPLNPADRKKMDKILIMKLKMDAKVNADISLQERIFLFIEGDCVNGRQAVAVSKASEDGESAKVRFPVKIPPTNLLGINNIYTNWTIGRCASAVKKALLLDESKIVRIMKMNRAIDYAEMASAHLNDMDTVKIQVI